MFDRLRARHPGSSIPHLLFYAFCRSAAARVLRILYRIRPEGREHVPATGPVLLVANHQSFFDPPIVGGFVNNRHTDFIARAGLFRFGPFGRLISALNSVPIAEQGGDTAAMKEALRRLGEGKAVLIFPEGSRSPDGAMRPFKRGISVLVKRAKCPVLPAAIEGVHDAWPRSRSRPHFFGYRIGLRYGLPIEHAELMKDGPDAALRRLEREIDAMRLELRAELRARTGGRLPAPGPGDGPMVDDGHLSE
ncbi:MAG: 1-acyl-sn-glycerol-3-phosphate acyltransferase [Phycisphaeraceae bacterium]|nr:MAG: 1-acyl-sn-glycerol-3-phosphate acyltransferase [Phycisphaeraceae bacterium]